MTRRVRLQPSGFPEITLDAGEMRNQDLGGLALLDWITMNDKPGGVLVRLEDESSRDYLCVYRRGGYGALYFSFNASRDTLPSISLSLAPLPDDAPVIVFEPWDHSKKLPATSIISYEQVDQALSEFVATGKRPTCVQWQESDLVRPEG